MLGVGLFLSYTRPPFVLYGTLWILLIAYITIELPAAYQQLQSAFRSVHPELEEASRMLGATRLRALRDVTAPLLRTSVLATWCFIFVSTIRELSAAVMLFTSETKVVSVLIFDLKESGDLGAIAVLGISMLILTFVVVIARQPHPGVRRGDAAAEYVTSDPHRQNYSPPVIWAPAKRAPRRIRPGLDTSRRVAFATLLRMRPRVRARFNRMDAKLPDIAVAEHLANRIAAVGAIARRRSRQMRGTLIDVVGLCIAARNEDYVQAALNGWDDDGPCTAIGHARTLSAAGAAFVNGTAAHGEDFDDTFEGGPVHAGAVLVPAVLAACERHAIWTARRRSKASRSASRPCAGSRPWRRPRRTRRASIRPRSLAPPARPPASPRRSA